MRLRLIPLAAVLLPCALGQRFDIVADNGSFIPGLGVHEAAVPLAVGDQGQWAAQVVGSLQSGLVVDGALVAQRTSIQGPNSFGERPRVAFNPAGRLAWSSTVAVGQDDTYRVFVDGAEILTTGDTTGVPDSTWGDLFVGGFSSGERVLLVGTVVAGSGERLPAMGYVDVNAAGAITQRGLMAVTSRPAPAGLPGTLWDISNVTTSTDGQVLWLARVLTASNSLVDYVLQDQTVLLSSLDPSPFDSRTWNLEDAALSLSANGSSWAVSGSLGGTGSEGQGIIANGEVRYAGLTALPDLEFYSEAAPGFAVIDDAANLYWSGRIEADDQRFQNGLFLNDSVIVQQGVTEVLGQTKGLLPLHACCERPLTIPVSSNRRFALMRQVRGFFQYALVLVDFPSAPASCGSQVDPYEPNDSCASASLVRSTEREVQLGAAHVTRQSDEDWYEITGIAGEVIRIRALHPAQSSEVDFEVFWGDCGAPQPLATADRDTPDEGVLVEVPTGADRLWIRVFVPDRSVASCAEYDLEIWRDLEPICTGTLFADDAFEPNDRPESAALVGLGSYPGLNASAVDPDYFTIELPPSSNVTARLSSAHAGLRLVEVLDRDLGAFNVFGVSLSNASDEPRQKTFAVIDVIPYRDDYGCDEYTLHVEFTGALSGGAVCGGVPNSSGLGAELEVYTSSLFGSFFNVSLRSSQLPPGEPGYFLASPGSPQVTTQPGGSQGNLCLGRPVGRVLNSFQMVDAFGDAWTVLNTVAVPLPGGAAQILSGSSWTFQFWYQDSNPLPTSNFSEAIQVTF